MLKKKPYQRQKEAREKGGRKRVYFDLTQKAIDLLTETSQEQHVPRPALIELMIRRYCAPNKERKINEF